MRKKVVWQEEEEEELNGYIKIKKTWTKRKSIVLKLKYNSFW